MIVTAMPAVAAATAATAAAVSGGQRLSAVSRDGGASSWTTRMAFGRPHCARRRQTNDSPAMARLQARHDRELHNAMHQDIRQWPWHGRAAWAVATGGAGGRTRMPAKGTAPVTNEIRVLRLM